jgi:hypothetical protein
LAVHDEREHRVVTVHPKEVAREHERLVREGWELVRRLTTPAGNVRLDFTRAAAARPRLSA